MNIISSNKKRKISPVTVVVFIIFLLIFQFSAFKIFGILSERNDAKTAYAQIQTAARETAPASGDVSDKKDNTSSESKSSGMDFDVLTSKYPGLVGWIRCEDTVIDYPVMQGNDNVHYLYYMYNEEENGSGSIFMDYRNAGDFKDRNNVIYGHHMKNGSMFHCLTDYESQDFYEAHPVMELFTPEGDYQIQLICGTVEDGSEEFVEFAFDGNAALNDYVQQFKARSTFESPVTLEAGDRIISLCTCSQRDTSNRYMLIGKLVPLD